jgi:serine/threonine protein kinase/WD40 repeat protein
MIGVGNHIGRYEVLARLGSGGMGEVYKVYDPSLDRPVALKILPADVVGDEDRLRRFIQEAKSASSLNHPHIVTIYEVGQVVLEGLAFRAAESALGDAADSASRTIHYIAMEFIDGDTLRARIHRDRTDLKRLLEFMAQVADGLSKAHQTGIVHRDLKPDNIMITPDSYAKILDFGLAKLVEPRRPITGQNTEAATALMEYTQPGVVMGTLGYMSPEQVQGRNIDHRSDIFSFGCILFEAATGRRPFEGDSLIDTLHKIVYSQAPPVVEFNPEAPVELQRIIRKCLAKDPDARYQSIKDVAIDIRDLIREYDSQPPLSSLSFATAAQPPVLTEAPQAIRAGRMSNRGRQAAFAVVALVLLAVGAFAFFKFVSQKHMVNLSREPFKEVKLTRLTSTGNVTGAAISPDGKYVAQVISEGGRQAIAMRQVATNSNVKIVEPVEGQIFAPVFSPDGNYVYYVLAENNKPARTLFRVPALGGDPRRVLLDIDSAITFSPDGKRIAFVRYYISSEESVLIVADADGSNEQRLATRRSPEFFNPEAHICGPAWSRDGKVIACSASGAGPSGKMNIIAIRLEDGSQQEITPARWQSVAGLSWLASGTGLLVVAQEQGSPSQVWLVSYPDGRSRMISNDLNSYNGLSVTADSTALVTLQREQISNIWLAAGASPNLARPVTSGTGKYGGLSWTPDGKIVYASSATGASDIWIMEADGTGQKQLTFKSGNNILPSVTPDGRYIFFASDRKGSFHIWRMDLDGSNPVQMTQGTLDYYPQPTPDGKWVIYPSYSAVRPTLWKVPVEGGDPVQLTTRLTEYPSVSPDGKFIACGYWDEQLSSRQVIAIIPIEGGDPIKTFDITGVPLVRWSPDGRALTYVQAVNGSFNIWSQPVAGGPARQLTDFKSERVFQFAWSRDGKQIACSRGNIIRDIVMMNESR